MSLIKFGLVGLLNSAIGFAVIWAALAAGFNDYAANAMGYGVGIVISYILNRKWTFAASDKPTLDEFFSFLVCFGIAYSANFLVIASFRVSGFSGKPWVHLLGMLVYSAIFFVLMRQFVFHARLKTYRATAANFCRSNASFLVLGVLAIATYLAIRNVPLSHDVAWQLWVARQLVHGSHLYTDIWEINPPLWFWSAVPIQVLGDAIHLPPLRLLVVIITGWGAAAALSVGWLGEFATDRRRTTAVALTFCILVLVPLVDFGQREHLALIVAVPYAALIAQRSRTAPGASVPVAAALLIGLMAAYGFALKHYFVAIPVLLELWLFARNRGEWRALRPETVILAMAALVYAACIVVFAPAFFTKMLPIINASYAGYESHWSKVILSGWVLIWVLIAGWFVFDRNGFGRRANPLVSTLLLVTLGFTFAYFAQAKAWHYHAVPVTCSALLALAIRLCDMPINRTGLFFPGIFIVGLQFATNLGAYKNDLAPELEPSIQSVKAGEPVLLFGADPRWVWPTFEDRGIVWPSRLSAYWMIPAIAHAETSGIYPAPLRALATRSRSEAALEIQCAAPVLVLFERRSQFDGQPRSFDERAFFLADPEIRAYLARHYREAGSTDAMFVYRRMDNAAARRDPTCPRTY